MMLFAVYTEMELKDIHMMEQLQSLVAQRSKVGIFMKFSVSVANENRAANYWIM